MACTLFTTTGIARWPNAEPSPHDEPTPVEIQRWEDDGGAVPPRLRRRPRLKPCHHERNEPLFDIALAEVITAG